MSESSSEKSLKTLTRRRRIGGGVLLVAAILSTVLFVRRAPASQAAADPGLRLVASIADRRIEIRVGDETVESYAVAVGKDGYPTPRGEFTIRRIVWNPSWVPPDSKWAKGKEPQAPGAAANPMKLVKLFFREPTYYIHGTGDVESLGDAASHGCLRMDPDDAYRLARYVMEHGGAPRDEAWYKRILKFRSEMKTVYLDNPVPLTIQ
jgi:murein L,D-transpeptidase YcbB/YkuD